MVKISKKIKFVILDFVKTLVEEKLDWDKLREINCQVFKKYGIDIEPQSLRPIIEQTAAQIRFLRHLHIGDEKISKIEKEIIAAQKKFEEDSIELFSLYPDSTTFISFAQKSNLKIGILTNNLSQTVKKVFLNSNAPFYGKIIGREDVKEPKPDSEGIIKLLKILGAKPSETILIGDSDFDIDVAKQISIYAIYIKRFKKWKLSYAKADQEINNLSEIVIAS